MRLGVIADVHVGNHQVGSGDTYIGMNDRCRRCVKVLGRAVEFATDEEELDEFYVAGDLFDTSKPLPQMISHAKEALSNAAALSRMVLLAGNHDRNSGLPRDNAIGPLGTSFCQIVERTDCCSGVLSAAFSPTLREDLPRLMIQAPANVLVTHVGIYDAQMAAESPYLVGSGISVDVLAQAMRDSGCRCVLSGDWHGHRIWEGDFGKIVQVGALVPTGWDNPGLSGYGKLCVYDTHTEELKVHEFTGPRFLEFPSVQLAAAGVHNAMLLGHMPENLYVKVTVPPHAYQAAKVAAADMLRGLAYLSLLVDREQVSSDVALAARVTTSTASLTTVVNRYVDDMKLAPDVDRDEVRRRSIDLLGLVGAS